MQTRDTSDPLCKPTEPNMINAENDISLFADATSGSGAKSAAQRAYDDLRARIVSMELAPDATLSRVELSAAYDVSQTPIREALQRLEQDGLVRIYPQSRTVVTRIDVAQLYESHFLRNALECEVVRQIALDPPAPLIARLRTLLRMQDAIAGDMTQIAVFNELDDAFHRAMFDAVGQTSLYFLVRSRSGHLARARRLDLPKGGKTRAILRGHGAIIDAIEAGQTVAAQDALRQHLTGTVARIAELIDEFPDYFRT
ncbi:hypothetical protein LCGC14_2244200 [marine sediment metagenome]|uniref:HTH gntR-type domain-containing protein n=1 Tax=marine sediment metagenome TaxID=412755 RepID=A0A0F9D4Q5_9ZZZZ